MDRIVRPRIRAKGVGRAAAASSEDSAHVRLLKYVPVEIAGAFPLLENVVAGYARNQLELFGRSPREVGWIIFCVLLAIFFWRLNEQFAKRVKGSKRWKLELKQMCISAIAFALWTYSIRSVIWEPIYEPGLALILVVLFLLAVGSQAPQMTPEEAREAGFIPPKSKAQGNDQESDS